MEEYKRCIQSQLDNADVLVKKAVSDNAVLSDQIATQREELTQLRAEIDKLHKYNQTLRDKYVSQREDLEVVKDFYSHLVQARIQSGSPYEDDQGLWFNVSQGNDTVSIDYKLGFVKGAGEGNINSTETNSTEIIYVPLLKELSLSELKLLQEKLPEYMFETLSFPLKSLNQFYSKMSKCLNKWGHRQIDR